MEIRKTGLFSCIMLGAQGALWSRSATPSPHLCKTSLQEWTPLRKAADFSHPVRVWEEPPKKPVRYIVNFTYQANHMICYASSV